MGDPFICGLTRGKIRALVDVHDEKTLSAGPSTPVVALGFESVPEAGDRLVVTASERQAKEVSQRRQLDFEAVHGRSRSKHLALEDLHKKIESGEVRELKLIIRADVQGSLEAIIGELSKLHHQAVAIKVLHSGMGSVSLSDVLLAAASDAIVLSFNADIDTRARDEAEKQGVTLQSYNIIYKLIDDIKSALEGLLEPVIKDVALGTADIRDVFQIPKVGKIAGCYVDHGKVAKDAHVRIMRAGVKIFEGKIASLKRIKESVNEVGQGFECGIAIAGYDAVKKGDRLEFFTQVKEFQKLMKEGQAA